MKSDRTIESLRQYFFPGWSTERLPVNGDVERMAYYRIECRTLEKYSLVCLVKPKNIRADILYIPQKRVS